MISGMFLKGKQKVSELTQEAQGINENIKVLIA